MGQQAPLIRLSHWSTPLAGPCILPFLASRQPLAMRQPLGIADRRRTARTARVCLAAQAGRSIENGHAGSFAANTVSAQATKRW